MNNTQQPRVSRGSARNMTPVYIARYIVFLVFYVVIMALTVFIYLSLLKLPDKNAYSGNFSLPAAAVKASADPVAVAVDGEEYVESVISNVTFSTDLSEYEQYMNPADRDAYITLVNQTHALDMNFKPLDLVDTPYVRSTVESPYIRKIAAEALEAMLSEAYAAGCTTTLTVTSCYRSYEYQQRLFDYRVSVYSYLGDEEARRVAATIVALPGESEHQTGLTADIHSLISADTSFDDTFEAKWLAENSWKFGFILRYPEDKVDITGISFEPWHFRFVGRYHAYKIYESGLCLEEYCEQTGLGLELPDNNT